MLWCAALGTAVIAAGCREKSPAERAKDLQEANAEVADEREDVAKASAALEKASDRYKKEKDELDRAEREARKAREKAAEQARRNSPPAPPAPPP